MSTVFFKLKVMGNSAENARSTHVIAQFDAAGKLLNPRSIAASSMFGWGKWQHSEKMPCSFGDLWWTSTPGHGGYILVTQNENLPEFKEAARTVDYELQGKRFKFQVFEFEEDCDWAIIEYRDPLLRAHSFNRVNANRARDNRPPMTEQEFMQDIIISSLNRWNKSFLDAKDRQPESVTT